MSSIGSSPAHSRSDVNLKKDKMVIVTKFYEFKVFVHAENENKQVDQKTVKLVSCSTGMICYTLNFNESNS